jgi:predicted hydrolase (HD superfamily)
VIGAGEVAADAVVAGAVVAGAVVEGGAECDVIAANRPKRMTPARGVALIVDRAMLLMCGSLGAH